MNRWSAPVATLFLATMLAGCTGGDVDASTDGTETDPGAALDADIEDITEGPPLLELENFWGETGEIILHDATHAGFNGLSSAANLPCIAAGSTYGTGCGYSFDLDGVVPMGTQSLRIEATLSDQGNTDYQYYLQTDERDGFADDTARSEAMAGPELEWAVAMLPAEWGDAPWLGLWAAGTGASMVNEIELTVTAIKDPEWVMPTIMDPWQDPANHTYTPEGSMVLHWSNDSHDWGGYAQSNPLGFSGDPEVPLDALVPPDTTHVIVAANLLSGPSCAPSDSCMADFNYHYGGQEVQWYQTQDGLERGAGWTLRVFEGDEVLIDNPAMSASSTYISLVLSGCSEAAAAVQQGNCQIGERPTDGTFEAAVLVEAWRAEPDLDAFKQRLGVE